MKGNDRPLHRVKPLRVHHLIMRIITIVCTLVFFFFSSSLCASRHRPCSSIFHVKSSLRCDRWQIRWDLIYIYIFWKIYYDNRLIELKKVWNWNIFCNQDAIWIFSYPFVWWLNLINFHELANKIFCLDEM